MSTQDKQALKRLIRPMSEAPRDGTTVLLLYRPQLYWAGEWHATGTKWEQCRWKEVPPNAFRAKGAWQPWCGSPRVTSTQSILEEDCIAWLEVPEQ